MRIVCPKCQHIEPEGTKKCSRCGAELISPHDSATLNIPAEEMQTLISDVGAPLPAPVVEVDTPVCLMVRRTGELIPLFGKEEFTIGRRSDRQLIVPDVDLTESDAHSLGVSRLHASIKIKDKDITIEDLGSTNGTRVSGKLLAPHKEHRLSHGEVILLGRFEVQVLMVEE